MQICWLRSVLIKYCKLILETLKMIISNLIGILSIRLTKIMASNIQVRLSLLVLINWISSLEDVEDLSNPCKRIQFCRPIILTTNLARRLISLCYQSIWSIATANKTYIQIEAGSLLLLDLIEVTSSWALEDTSNKTNNNSIQEEVGMCLRGVNSK